MARGRPLDDDETFDGGGEGEYCDVCKQEYLGHCPIRSSRCPFENPGATDDEDDPDHASSRGDDDDA